MPAQTTCNASVMQLINNTVSQPSGCVLLGGGLCCQDVYAVLMCHVLVWLQLQAPPTHVAVSLSRCLRAAEEGHII